MATVPDIGQLAPDFTLEGCGYDERADYTLSARRGQPVVLVFYPGDDSMVCSRQLCSYNDELSAFKNFDAEVWAINSQSIESHEAFAAKRGLKFPLLSDPKKEVIEAYGVDGPLGVKRSIFLVDRDGKIAWSHVAKLGLTFQSADVIAGALASL